VEGPIRGAAARSERRIPFSQPTRRPPLGLAGNELVVACVGYFALLVVVALPGELVQDSWLTLVSGREVAAHGLPAHDGLTAWTLGVRWIDQQWLAQLAFYGLARVGGLKLVLLAHAALVVGAVAVCVVGARRLGASQQSAVLCAAAVLPIAPWALQMRAQSVAELLFAVVLWLLAADSRAPSRRVYLVLPLLVLWGNVHGTATLGALLVVARGVSCVRSERTKAAALVLATPLCLLVSPYGLELVGYYRRLLFNPLLRSFVQEWGPSRPSPATAGFYALALVTLWLLARRRRRLTGFEQAALLVTLASAVSAVRGIVWFGFAALMLLPNAIDGTLPESRALVRLRPLTAALAAAAVVGAVAALGLAVARGEAAYTRAWPTAALPPLAAAAGRDGRARVLASDRYADWVLWNEPQLEGRVAYDVRFELFTRAQFEALARFRAGGGAPSFAVALLDRAHDAAAERELLRRPDERRVYGDSGVAVFARERGGAPRGSPSD
jgi:hypothetical protein